MAEINVYAPVLITTLNRFNHLKNCIETLENCTGASETDVFVALDFPPSDKYVEGWKKIDGYLKEKEQSNKFKKLVVIRREYNLGLGCPAGNSITLKSEVLENYDRFIVSEDDNVFSPNFLEYMNKGLELYKNDRRIYAICGYKCDFKCRCSNNNHIAMHSGCPTWGYGIWANRYLDAKESLTPAYYRRILYSPKKWYKCFKYWPHWMPTIIGNAMSLKNFIPMTDMNVLFYLICENLCSISPVVSKVKNNGLDELATTTKLDQGNLKGRAIHENNLVIDDEKTFEFVGDPYQFEDENSLAMAKWDGQWETTHNKSLWYVYFKIIKFRLLALLGIV